MKILILNPPFLKKFSRSSRSPAVTKSGTIYYPTWLAYAAGMLEREAHEVRLIDAPASGMEVDELLDILQKARPGLLFMDSATASYHNDMKVAVAIKNVLPNVSLVMVGTHVSAMPEAALRDNLAVDFVCRREYEITAVKLAEALERHTPLTEVDGLSFRSANGRIVHNKDRGYIDDLDALPFVSAVFKKHLRIEDYFYAHIRYPMVSIFTSRGCPSRCMWCVYPQVFYGHGYRHRSAESIVAEFEYIERELPQVREVLIDDDTFNIDVEHTRETCRLMMQRGIRLDWTCEVRANLDYETMVMMKKARCRLMVVGFESGVREVLKAMKKGLSPEQGVRFAQDARRAGIMVHGCFVVGNPGETKESLEESLRYAKRLPIDTAQFFPMMLYPGTEAYDWAKVKGYLRTEDFSQWVSPDGLHNTMVDRPGLSHEYLVEFCDRARREFYLRPAYIVYKLRQVIAHPSEFRRTMKAAKRFYRFLFPRGVYSIVQQVGLSRHVTR